MTKGEIWNSIRFYGESETSDKSKRLFMFEIRLYNTEKRLDLACSIIKKSIIDPESFYIAFPFNMKDGKHFTEVQGGVIETGKDQIKGSSNDWYTVQNFTSVRNSNAQTGDGLRRDASDAVRCNQYRKVYRPVQCLRVQIYFHGQ